MFMVAGVQWSEIPGRCLRGRFGMPHGARRPFFPIF